jgi:hypothetical protein
MLQLRFDSKREKLRSPAICTCLIGAREERDTNASYSSKLAMGGQENSNAGDKHAIAFRRSVNSNSCKYSASVLEKKLTVNQRNSSVWRRLTMLWGVGRMSFEVTTMKSTISSISLKSLLKIDTDLHRLIEMTNTLSLIFKI